MIGGIVQGKTIFAWASRYNAVNQAASREIQRVAIDAGVAKRTV
jgi:hypothetical protein